MSNTVIAIAAIMICKSITGSQSPLVITPIILLIALVIDCLRVGEYISKL